MKTWSFLPLLFVCYSLVAQQTPYQSFEVDSAADPRGGMAYLTTFIQANLRKPIAAEAVGIGGIVIVGGTVEADGQIANVTILKSLRPDCDREAVRVFKLFNAWKPAIKASKAVSQRVSIPIKFNPNAPFLYRGGAQITFFDKNQKLVADSSIAVYKQITPMDSIGLPAGDIVLYQLQGKKWQEQSKVPFVREQRAARKATEHSTYSIGYPNSIIEYNGQYAIVDESGKLLRRAYFQNRKRIGPELRYHQNGVIAERTEDTDDQTVYTFWHANGQIKQIKTLAKSKPLEASQSEHVSAFWDSTGHQVVKNGSGRVVYQTSLTSKADTTQRTTFTEQGGYQNELKQGTWTGRYADGSYYYEEQYEQGICQTGKAKSAGSDTARYTLVEQVPEFQGGIPGLQKFLMENLRYPVDAQRAGAQGKVFVSFVVCTDGTLCDYKVLKGAHPDLDKEAVRVVEKMSGHWKPGVQRGEKVRVKYNLPVNFNLY